MRDYSTELDFAISVTELGGRIALEHFGKGPDKKLKSDGSWVTEVDWKVEAQIRLRIARTFPDHNILGEEEGLTAAGGGPPHDGAPTWVIDPIDGTNNYIAQIPIWATLLALRVDDESVLGVAHAPTLGETYEACLGGGARKNGRSIHVEPVERLKDALLCHGGYDHLAERDLTGLFEELAARTVRSRGFGDFWGHMLVARGAAHVMFEPKLALWDVAALEPIVTEAGGKLTTLTGERFRDGDSVLTTCGTLHDEVVELARPFIRR